ncbi:zf-HC2 domain-containing protein [Pyxidicoccus fallax]|uniref:Zf-HC2 domain-containing protein n=1 Tax=Pyxidicoccus fallax TaxID=394095 RepID=A0A848L5F1_9BACT|nr:zf-HC2 domain-containing protein [Pyxidicoccus fallax]NMO13502.1 zf-HC2 domain-containing protein [Pyxidicoccus fallax]NPC78547.1 zf-HC2 domain-containing protein [Pyxidicoccus fallax]
MACLDADIAAYTAHALTPEEARAVEEHIDTCSACREWVSMLAKAGMSRSTGVTGSRSGSEVGNLSVLPRGTRVGPFELDGPLDA